MENLELKTSHRLRQIRKKYRLLCWTSHEHGAGGATQSKAFTEYRSIVRQCDEILSSREKINRHEESDMNGN